MAGGDEPDDVADDRREAEVLRRVDGGDPGPAQRLDVGLGDDPPDDHRDVDPPLGEGGDDLGDQLAVRPGEDRQADHVDTLLEGRVGDLAGGQPDALVDDLHPGVAGVDGDLLGPVRVAVEARLADQQLDPPAEPGRDLLDPGPDGLELGGRERGARPGLADPGRGAVVAEGVAQGLGPLPGGDPGAGRVDRGDHDVLIPGRRPAERVERRGHGRRIALRAPELERRDLLGLEPGGHHEDPALGVGGQGRRLGLGEPVDADDGLLAGLDPADPLPVGVDQGRLHVGDGGHGAAVLGDHGHLGPGPVEELPDQALHDDRPGEDVRVLEQIGLEGEDLLDAQRPLLVPGPGEAERLVPRRELDRPGAGVAAEGHGEGLEHDPLDVVLRLGLGQPERIDLDAVAEAQELGVADAVAPAADLLPEDRHRPELGVLLDEADAGVDEERDPAEHRGHEVGVPVEAGAHAVEHGDRVAHRVGDLLDRRGPGLLEVVGADVDRVPGGDVLDRVGDRVGDQAHRRLGGEGVGAPGEELLDDVVLGRPRQPGRVDPLVLGGDDVEGQQPGGGRVDRHRGVHLAERDPVEEDGHVAAVGDRDPDLPDLAPGELVVAVVAGLGRQVEGDRQAGLALGQVLQIEGVRRAGRRVARVGADQPRSVRLREPMGVAAHDKRF